MKVTYNQDVDILMIRLKDDPVAESDELMPSVIVDYNDRQQIVGIEILDASENVDKAKEMQFSFVEQPSGDTGVAARN